MQNRYSPEEAARAVETWGAPAVSDDLALRTYTARLLGREPALVLHGGGNTSVKSVATTRLGERVGVLQVKGSGWDLATILPAGHPAVRLEPLLRLRALAALTDEAMVNELRLDLLDAAAPTPSVETLLHAFLPAKFIDHTHADAILAIADQPDGERVCRSLFGEAMVWVPYVMPGFLLAKRCADAFDAAVARGAVPSLIVLERHGLFTFGATAEESYARTIDAVSRAEEFVAARRKVATVVSLPRRRSAAAEAVLPRLRGVLAKLAGEAIERGPILELDDRVEMLAFLDRKDAAALVEVGCATPDHVLRTKPTALLVSEPAYDDPEKLGAQLEAEIAAYARRYDAYFAEMSAPKRVTRKKLDPWPRVVLLPGLGACSVGKTQRDARIARDIYAHTIEVMGGAAAVGRYQPVSRADLFDVEYWSLEQAKLKPLAEPSLFGKVVVVTGAASGIGRATAARFRELGASVAILDKDEGALEAARVALSAGGSEVRAIAVDVTSWEKVRAAVADVVRFFGGIDVLVSNAGNAPEGQLQTESGDAALRGSLETNLLSHNHLVRAVLPVMIAQGRGGALLFNASKSAWNPGPNFGPYAVAKAALVALMRQYAVDAARHGVRANAVNADRIRTGLFGGGVVESRAAARGLTVAEYFRANLLSREVTASDVADAFVYLASAPATTGCVLTVDGGNPAAFPR